MQAPPRSFETSWQNETTTSSSDQEKPVPISGATLAPPAQEWCDQGAQLCSDALSEFMEAGRMEKQETRDYGSIQQMYETAVRKCETAIALWRAASLNGDDERIKRCIEWASGLKNQLLQRSGLVFATLGDFNNAVCRFTSILGCTSQVPPLFANVKSDTLMYLAEVFTALGRLDGAVTKCVEAALKMDPSAKDRHDLRFKGNQSSLNVADEAQKIESKALMTGFSGLITLRQTPVKEAHKVKEESDWSTYDGMAASLLLDFAKSPSKNYPNENAEESLYAARHTSPFSRTFNTTQSPTKAGPFAVYQDSDTMGSPLPPRLPRTPSSTGGARWCCKVPSCSKTFATRDALRAHSKETGHPGSGEKLFSVEKHIGRKHGLSPQPKNMNINEVVDRPGKRQASNAALSKIAQAATMDLAI